MSGGWRTIHAYEQKVEWVASEFVLPEWTTHDLVNEFITASNDIKNGKTSAAFQRLISVLELERERLINTIRAEALQKALSAAKCELPYDWRETIQGLIMTAANGDDLVELNIDWSLLPHLMEKFFEQYGIGEANYNGPKRTFTDNPQA
jgi:hypothetical protein